MQKLRFDTLLRHWGYFLFFFFLVERENRTVMIMKMQTKIEATHSQVDNRRNDQTWWKMANEKKKKYYK